MGGGNKTSLLRLVFFVETEQNQAYDINMLSPPPPTFKHLKWLADFHVLQTAHHWRAPQAVIFNFPTNGTPLEGAPSRNILF